MGIIISVLIALVIFFIVIPIVWRIIIAIIDEIKFRWPSDFGDNNFFGSKDNLGKTIDSNNNISEKEWEIPKYLRKKNIKDK